MNSTFGARVMAGRLWIWGVVAMVLLASVQLGSRPSLRWLILPLAGMGGFALLQQPVLGLLAVVAAALVAHMEIGTGTDVSLNPATLLVPALLAVWVLDMMRRREIRIAPSRVNRPLLLFLVAGLLSLVIGWGAWDQSVPRADSFWIVQLAQWVIFAFSAGALWLMGNMIPDEIWLRRFTFFYLAVAGSVAILFVLPRIAFVVGPMTTGALGRAPFWMLLTAMSMGQLLFNRLLARGWRIFLLSVLGAVALYIFYWNRKSSSPWVSVIVVAGVLGWLRWPRLRWPVILLLVALAVSGVLFSTAYEFAGGEAEWESSGGSRLALIGRVIEVTMRNPITGLGPAAYRLYAGMEPLAYGRAYWVAPRISSHNNYVDLFSQVGLLGLTLFFWFAIEVARLGLRLRARFREGFAAGYVNGILAAGAGALVLMMLADWILPFVYNIGFPGFQASVLVWLFMGGLVALDQVPFAPDGEDTERRTKAGPDGGKTN